MQMDWDQTEKLPKFLYVRGTLYAYTYIHGRHIELGYS